MDAERSNNVGINLSIQAKDERYPITVYLNGNNTPTLTVYFNPGDPFVMEYANALSNLDGPGVNSERDEVLSFTAELKKNIDAIFGDGAARTICRYDGAERALLNALLEKVKEGYTDFNERAKAAQEAEKRKARAEAKEEAKAFITGKS